MNVVNIHYFVCNYIAFFRCISPVPTVFLTLVYAYIFIIYNKSVSLRHSVFLRYTLCIH